MEKNKVFIIRPLNEEQNDFIITVGKHLATEKHFKTKKDAEKYINYPKWDTVIALMSEILEHQKELNNEETEKTNR